MKCKYPDCDEFVGSGIGFVEPFCAAHRIAAMIGTEVHFNESRGFTTDTVNIGCKTSEYRRRLLVQRGESSEHFLPHVGEWGPP